MCREEIAADAACLEAIRDLSDSQSTYTLEVSGMTCNLGEIRKIVHTPSLTLSLSLSLSVIGSPDYWLSSLSPQGP